MRQRRASATGELDVARKRDRQVLVAHRDRPVGIAIHHRDGRSPVALPGDQPVAQAIRDRRPSDAATLRLLRDSAPAVRSRRSAERPASDHAPLA